MRNMEAEAYLLGNGLIFRDYEDQLKENNTMIKSLLQEEALDKLTDIAFKMLQEKQLSTPKYDENPALIGDQDTLPDSLQQAIISKAGGETTDEAEMEEGHYSAGKRHDEKLEEGDPT
ncbi:MAG TPA: hypothetical protein DHV30_05040, partial [Balneola sp.]|nr:hypothetical protein [Balneola sp.]